MPSPLSFVETVQTSVLPSGVRVVTESVDTVASASVGIWVATGSRDEEPAHRGIAHFLEHMLFKGTERRPTAKDIADEMDNVGGYLNAFTDKEYTCYYARVLGEDVPLALDLLADMFRHSRFDAGEMAREQKVVLEEIKERDDAPDDLVHDLFAETLYPDHPLGRAVIGTAETVAALTPDDLRGYMARHCGAGAVIVTVSGNCDHARITDLAQALLGDLGGSAETAPAVRPLATTGIVTNIVRPTEQINFVVGTSAFGVVDDERYALSVLNTVLGDSMGSRLFQEIREVRGLGYTIGSYANMHREGGYFAVYGGTSPRHLRRMFGRGSRRTREDTRYRRDRCRTCPRQSAGAKRFGDEAGIYVGTDEPHRGIGNLLRARCAACRGTGVHGRRDARRRFSRRPRRVSRPGEHERNRHWALQKTPRREKISIKPHPQRLPLPRQTRTGFIAVVSVARLYGGLSIQPAVEHGNRLCSRHGSI